MEHWMYSIEWLKRGIPNAHFLIWMKDKICPTQIDSIISSKFLIPKILHASIISSPNTRYAEYVEHSIKTDHASISKNILS